MSSGGFVLSRTQHSVRKALYFISMKSDLNNFNEPSFPFVIENISQLDTPTPEHFKAVCSTLHKVVEYDV